MLGDDCLFDKIENATFRKEATGIFFYLVWMWNPNFLHRSKRMTIFLLGAGQSLELGAYCSRGGRWHLHLEGTSI